MYYVVMTQRFMIKLVHFEVIFFQLLNYYRSG